MRISVFGCGYLGAVHAAAMAHLGHDVIGIDVDAAKVERLRRGEPPFYEPGLAELLRDEVASGRLRFSTDPAEARDATVHFIAVGTPQTSGALAADLSYVDAAIDTLLGFVGPGHLIVGKSTVPVGTAERLVPRVEATGASLAWNPEFLREGFAVKDTIEPDRIVYGVAGPGPAEVLDEVYATAIATGVPRIVTSLPTAELVKVSANAFLATKISFINAMAEIADATGADVMDLADAIGHDTRIGRRFLGAGVGFGGGCLPKDIRAFSARAEELGLGQSVAFLREIDAINSRQRSRLVDLAVELLAGDVVGRRIAILGVTFKPESDDVRDSPALDVAVRLKGLGADVIAADPQGVENARARHPQLSYTADGREALRGAELTLLVTQWPEYRHMDPAEAAALVANPIMVDGRNSLDHAAWRAAGWTVRGIGRPRA